MKYQRFQWYQDSRHCKQRHDQYPIPSLGQLVSWASTTDALSFQLVDTQSISIPAQLVAIAAASHAAVARINDRSACSKGISTPTLSAPLSPKVRVAATESSACLQRHSIAPQHILRQRTHSLAVSDTALELVVANGIRLLGTSQGRILVERQAAGATA